MLEFLFCAFAVIFGAGSMEVRRFEASAAEQIKAQLQGEPKVSIQTKLSGIIDGPLGDLKMVSIRAEHFTTEGLPLFVEPERSKKGRIQELRLELRDFTLRGLRMDSLVANIPECRYDYSLAIRKRQVVLSKSGEGTGRVRILEADLASYILHKFKEIKSVEVRVADDKVRVAGRGVFLLIETDFEVIARLTSPEGKTLELSESRIFFDGKPAGSGSSKAVLQTLNPVVDLDKDLGLHGAIKVEGVKLQNGVLEAWGTTRIPTRPKL